MKGKPNHIRQSEQTGVTFILIKPDGKILMQLRDNGNGKYIPYPNMWCFPGGGKENEESYLNTTLREVKEEYDLDINADNCILLTCYNHDNITDDHVYICTLIQNCQPKLREGRDMQWKEFRAIKELTLAWEQNKILKALELHLKDHHFQ